MCLASMFTATPRPAARIFCAKCSSHLTLLRACCVPLCRGLQSTDNKYFNGKKRFTHLVMQGRFKHDVKASDLWTGHEWFQISDLVPTR